MTHVALCLIALSDSMSHLGYRMFRRMEDRREAGQDPRELGHSAVAGDGVGKPLVRRSGAAEASGKEKPRLRG